MKNYADEKDTNKTMDEQWQEPEAFSKTDSVNCSSNCNVQFNSKE